MALPHTHDLQDLFGPDRQPHVFVIFLSKSPLDPKVHKNKMARLSPVLNQPNSVAGGIAL